MIKDEGSKMKVRLSENGNGKNMLRFRMLPTMTLSKKLPTIIVAAALVTARANPGAASGRSTGF